MQNTYAYYSARRSVVHLQQNALHHQEPSRYIYIMAKSDRHVQSRNKITLWCWVGLSKLLGLVDPRHHSIDDKMVQGHHGRCQIEKGASPLHQIWRPCLRSRVATNVHYAILARTERPCWHKCRTSYQGSYGARTFRNEGLWPKIRYKEIQCKRKTLQRSPNGLCWWRNEGNASLLRLR